MQAPEQQPNDNEIKQQAIRRVLIAIALIMAAIVVLNALSRLKESQQKTLSPEKADTVASAAATVTPQTTPTIKPDVVASKAEYIEQPASEAPVSSSVSSTPKVEAASSHPAPPVVVNNAGRITPKANDSLVISNNEPTTIDNLPGTPLAIPAKPAPAHTKTTTIAKPSLTQPTPSVTPSSAKPQPITPPAKPIVPAATMPINNNHLAVQSYTVQAGVFGQYENANTLYQKLREQGIPVRLESRVVIGPFKDKTAAEAATRELQSLGIKPLVIPNVTTGK